MKDKLKIEAVKDGKGNVIISEESLEFILKCLDNQKFINNLSDEPSSLSPEEYFHIQYKNYKIIVDVEKQVKDILDK